MAASGPGITDIKILFARSGNRCAFPKCTAPMAVNETLTGEVCHIKGARPGSARHDPSQTDMEKHDYKNLILMCPNHHTVIDDDEGAYSVEYLLKLKRLNEERSQPIAEDEASRVAQHFILISNGQSGGISAHTVNASQITFQSAPSASHLTHQRQIQAIEALWQIARNLGNEFSMVIFVDNIFLASEQNNYFRSGAHNQFMSCIQEYADINTAIDKMKTAGALDQAQKERPFVSHRLWSIFFVLQAVYGRTALLLTNSYKARKLEDWRDDSGCDQLLRAILSSPTIEEAKAKSIGGLRFLIDHLESRFLAEAGMNKQS